MRRSPIRTRFVRPIFRSLIPHRLTQPGLAPVSVCAEGALRNMSTPPHQIAAGYTRDGLAERRRLTAVLGPTNTGKTHLAIERMMGHETGMIGLPLRLLAREVYDRVVKVKGPRAVALITGEEKILPASARYFICTVEAMPLDREVDFL